MHFRYVNLLCNAHERPHTLRKFLCDLLAEEKTQQRPNKQGKLLIIIIITHKLLIIIIIIHNLEQLKVGQMDACLDKTQIGLNN